MFWAKKFSGSIVAGGDGGKLDSEVVTTRWSLFASCRHLGAKKHKKNVFTWRG